MYKTPYWASLGRGSEEEGRGGSYSQTWERG